MSDTQAPRGFPSPSCRRHVFDMTWGGVRGGGTPDLRGLGFPPTLSLPHKGGGDAAARSVSPIEGGRQPLNRLTPCAPPKATPGAADKLIVKAGLSERRPVGIPCGGMGWGLVAADTSLSREGGTRRRSEDGLPFWRRDYAQTNRFELARRRRDDVRGRHRERTDG